MVQNVKTDVIWLCLGMIFSTHNRPLRWGCNIYISLMSPDQNIYSRSVLKCGLFVFGVTLDSRQQTSICRILVDGTFAD